MKPYTILSLDGGGVRGILTATLLYRIECELPGWLEKIDLIAGTSSGGLIALGLAHCQNPGRIMDVIAGGARDIFQDSVWDNLKDMGMFFGAQYSNKNLRAILKRQFASAKLKDLQKQVLISAFDLDPGPGVQPRHWRPKLFHNLDDGDELLVDVALRTAALPVFFPTYQGYVDGGAIGAGNPSMCAISHVMSTPKGIQYLEEVRVLSIGSGQSSTILRGQDLDWGITQWVVPLVRLVLDGSCAIVDDQCRRLLRGYYFRLNPELDKQVLEDDVSQVDYLIRQGEIFNLEPALSWLKEALR